MLQNKKLKRNATFAIVEFALILLNRAFPNAHLSFQIINSAIVWMRGFRIVRGSLFRLFFCFV